MRKRGLSLLRVLGGCAGKTILIVCIIMASFGIAHSEHFNFVIDNPQLINPDSSIMTIYGTIQINNQNPEPRDTSDPNKLGDEIGAFFNQKLCGALAIQQDANSYYLPIYNNPVITNGPSTGNIIGLRIWDKSAGREYSQEVVLDIQDAAIKNAQGNLLWKAGDWVVNLSVSIPVRIFEIQPSSGSNSTYTSVTIKGEEFNNGAMVVLGGYELTQVMYIDPNTLTAVVQAGLPAGIYDLTITNPDGRSATLSPAFEVKETLVLSLDFVPGLNTFSYPFQNSGSLTSYGLLEGYFSPQTVENICSYNKDTQEWMTTGWSDTGEAEGTEFTIQDGEGYLLYVNEDIQNVYFSGQYPSVSLDIREGFNIVSIALPQTANYDAFCMIDQIGYSKAISLSNYNQDSGKWGSAFWFFERRIAGDNFKVKNAKGYVVNMEEDVFDWSPSF
ncbi:IPT/TIG domain-containing protein [bacterium]|nr:IPT/TIG domain-containing protein [bacterium]